MNEKAPLNGNGNGLMVAAIVGLAVGASVALLLAPCSGKETRGWLANRSRDIKDRTASAFEHGKTVVRRAAKLGTEVAQVAAGNDGPSANA